MCGMCVMCVMCGMCGTTQGDMFYLHRFFKDLADLTIMGSVNRAAETKVNNKIIKQFVCLLL